MYVVVKFIHFSPPQAIFLGILRLKNEILFDFHKQIRNFLEITLKIV